jgi:hypothetical protein
VAAAGQGQTSMRDDKTDLSALKREWLAARIAVIGGFAIMIGIGIYVAVSYRAELQHAKAQAAAAIAKQQQDEKLQQTNLEAERAFCRALLAQTQNIGLVPNFAKLTDPLPKSTKQTGRYTCEASTGASTYELTADLICRDLKKTDCLSLYQVSQKNGAVLFQRHD